MIGTEAFDRFVAEHRWAVLTTLRETATGSEPVSSVIAYARDGDDLVVSTPGGTFKRRSIERNPRVNLCVISNAEPFNFVAIEGDARVQLENLLEDTRRVFAAIRDTGYQEPEDLPSWLEKQRRVILRITPRRVYGVIR
jgi:PPOX class probable F420-dependent enzyme